MVAVFNAIDKGDIRKLAKKGLPESAFRKSKNKREDKCRANLKNKCHVQKRKYEDWSQETKLFP